MKITCSMCRNEEDKMCRVKKIGVHVNKRRDCDKFILEPSKVKERQILETVKVPYAQREAVKKQIKAALKTAQQPDAAHPLTGDLSRFTSTAARG